MKNRKRYKLAMQMLGTTNILSTFLLYLKWVIRPNIAVKLAKKIANDINTSNQRGANIVAIGYLNEFFSKYLEFGKTKEQIIQLNEQIDKQSLSSRDRKTKDKVISTLIELRTIRNRVKKFDTRKIDQRLVTKTFFGVSKGLARGKILNVNSVKQIIPNNCIGIFPTSGVKFTSQFLKCKGIIFLNGGMTSHGAILAREFDIPAIINPFAKIEDGILVEIDGNIGSVKRLVDKVN